MIALGIIITLLGAATVLQARARLAASFARIQRRSLRGGSTQMEEICEVKFPQSKFQEAILASRAGERFHSSSKRCGYPLHAKTACGNCIPKGRRAAEPRG